MDAANARVIDLRFFAGLSRLGDGQVLQISPQILLCRDGKLAGLG